MFNLTAGFWTCVGPSVLYSPVVCNFWNANVYLMSLNANVYLMSLNVGYA